MRSSRARSIRTTWLFRSGEFFTIGHSHERGAVRVFVLSRIRGNVTYASEAGHDFQLPEDFDREAYKEFSVSQLGALD
jgi:predicted DNA-binding transcriptional regulator YafY